MNDIRELNDEELEKVNGGIEYSITRVDPGDVFIDKAYKDTGFVVTERTAIEDDYTLIPFRSFRFYEGKWETYGPVNEKYYISVKNSYYFSVELTGKISY